jgi:PadR family transcriptional regulator PadR
MMILDSVRRLPIDGYALAQYIRQRSDELEEESLYPALQRLLRGGLIRGQWETSATSRRAPIYRITQAGLKHLKREVSRFDHMLEGVRLVLSPSEP